MSFFPWISPEQQARKLATLFPKHLAGIEPEHIGKVANSLRLQPGERVLVVPNQSSLCEFAWMNGRARGVDYNHAALVWFIHLLKLAKFPLEDNLADESVGMERSERFVRTISQTREGYAAWQVRVPSPFLLLPVLLDVEVGKSPFAARESILRHRHFPLEPLALLSLLFTHHEELGDTVFWLDAVGAEVSPKGDDRFDDAPYLDRRGSSLVNLDWNWGKRRRSFRFAPSSRLP